jgi:[acyl-carrier-protein] S-malonyltransferase
LKPAHLFPAFVPEYLGIETDVIGQHILIHKLEKASAFLGYDLTGFDIVNQNYLDDPLKSQVITYVMSCCVSDLLHNRNKTPAYVASFSMGIYAALYHCKAISLETGLQMISTAYDCIENILPEIPMGMCVIGGLSLEDINLLINQYGDNVAIINQNSEFSFILSGHREALMKITEQAKTEGAMQARMLPVVHPYHSSMLKKASEDFNLKLTVMTINDSVYPLVSAINQNIIFKKNDIIRELTGNLFQPFHWWTTFKFLLSKNVNLFIECGAGESLYKVGKFIEGDFSVINLKKIGKYINE